MIRIQNIKLSLDEAVSKDREHKNLKPKICERYRISKNDIHDFSIHRKAVDARKDRIQLVYHVNLSTSNETQLLHRFSKEIIIAEDQSYQEASPGALKLKHRPIVVGFGPSGIFASYILAKQGYKPIVLERGLDVDQRTDAWEAFLKDRVFKESGSILFGEGGAGTFSDGKLTTLVNDYRSKMILDILIKAGANPEIGYLNKPHIGTDELKIVTKNIRQEIARMGGEIRFGSQMTDLMIENNQLKAVVVNHQTILETEVILMGIGHSARDTFKLLHEKQVEISQKAFSIGLRIEHPQTLINKSQYGEHHNHPALGAADYKLSYHSPSGRSAYTFCMCPGGFVVGSISEPESICTNGMSYAKRDGVNANSALLVNVTPDDFPSRHPLAGMDLQREIERKAYDVAGKDYFAPVQLVGDFLRGHVSTKFGSVEPTYLPGTRFIRMEEILPRFVTDTLKEALLVFDRKIKGFAMDEALLTGPETRSSSPIRIKRDETHESNISGIYPMGEGAGYAGGIMSSAIDGIKTAEKIISKYHI